MTHCPFCRCEIAEDQSYCVRCGAPLKAPPDRATAEIEPSTPAQAALASSLAGPAARRWTVNTPSPRAAAALAVGFLGLGSVVGAAAQPGRSLAGRPPVVLASAPVPAAVAPPPATPADVTDADPVEPTDPEATTDTTVDDSTTLDLGDTGVGAEEDVVPADDTETDPGPDTQTTPDDTPAEPAAPTIKHVWTIMLTQTSFDAAYGPDSPIPSLAVTGAARGTLLTQVHSVAHGTLPGGVALLSGQDATAQQRADCPAYSPVTPETVDQDGLATGDGCVFPAQVSTIFDQFRANGLGWKVYSQDGEKSVDGTRVSCRHPELGQVDPWQLPRPGDAFVTPRNPAVYFRSVVDVPECQDQVVGFDAFAKDLLAPSRKAPAFSLIVLNACLDGRVTPCEAGKPSGLAATEPALAYVLRQITRSAAYKDHGLIIVTSDQGAADDTAGLDEKTPGGGRIGALLLSPEVRRGYVDDTRLDQFSLLRMVQDLFAFTPIGHAVDAPVVPPEIFQPE